MTTRDFIAKRYNVPGKHQWCSSVLADSNGTIYSYGSHYPLAFRVKGLDFINTSGYSNTTQRHISWAKQALGYNYHGVKLWREDAQVIASDYTSAEHKLDAIKTALKRELDSLSTQMAAKKRKDTQVYSYLLSDYEKAAATLATVTSW